jgi:hypothetical protein
LHPATLTVTRSFCTPSVSVKETLPVHAAQLSAQLKEHDGWAALREVGRGGQVEGGLQAVPSAAHWTSQVGTTLAGFRSIRAIYLIPNSLPVTTAFYHTH